METRQRDELKRHHGFDVAVRRMLGMPTDPALRDPFRVAHERHIPAWLVGNASAPRVQAFVARERVDVLVVAFFNQLLSQEILAIPRLGAVNLPLFWSFHDAVERIGLTMHRISPREDDGDIVLQEALPIEFGAAGEDVIDDLATSAARMVIEGLAQIERDALSGIPQDGSLATRAPRPSRTDLLVDPHLGARRVFHFVRGVGRWNPLCADVGNGPIRVIDAVEIDETIRLPGHAAVVGDLLHLGCDDGMVVLRTRMTQTPPW
jgi:methionyl-tRNA formyltransferase